MQRYCTLQKHLSGDAHALVFVIGVFVDELNTT